MHGVLLHTWKSRYGDERTLIGVDDRTFIIEGPSHFSRSSADESGQFMVDFEGGPFVMRGLSIEQVTGFAMSALIESVRSLPCEKPNHARCEVVVKQTKPGQQR
jgi:hypothetical protein